MGVTENYRRRLQSGASGQTERQKSIDSFVNWRDSQISARQELNDAKAEAAEYERGKKALSRASDLLFGEMTLEDKIAATSDPWGYGMRQALKTGVAARQVEKSRGVIDSTSGEGTADRIATELRGKGASTFIGGVSKNRKGASKYSSEAEYRKAIYDANNKRIAEIRTELYGDPNKTAPMEENPNYANFFESFFGSDEGNQKKAELRKELALLLEEQRQYERKYKAADEGSYIDELSARAEAGDPDAAALYKTMSDMGGWEKTSSPYKPHYRNGAELPAIIADPVEAYRSMKSEENEDSTPKYGRVWDSEGWTSYATERQMIGALAEDEEGYAPLPAPRSSETPFDYTGEKNGKASGNERSGSSLGETKVYDKDFFDSAGKNLTDAIDKRFEAAETERVALAMGLPEMKDGELKRYREIRNTKGYEAAEEYLKELRPTLNKRQLDKALAAYADWYENASGFERVVGGGVVGIGRTLVKPFIDMAAFGEYLASGFGSLKGYNPYGGALGAQYDLNAERSYTWDYLNDKSGKLNLGLTEIGLGDVAGFLSSGIDSLYSMWLLGGDVTAAKIAPIFMGMGASASDAGDLWESGAAPWQIVTKSIATGVIEWATEKFSLDNFAENFLEKPITSALDWLKKMGLQNLIEGTEEVAGNILNRGTDIAILGPTGEEAAKYNRFRSAGMSDAKAIAAMLWDNVREDSKAMIGGFISGIPMAGIGLATQAPRSTGRTIIESGQTDALIDAANKAAESSYLSNKTGERLLRAVKDAKNNPTATRIGFLRNAVDAANAEITSARIEKTLADNGVTGKAAEVMQEAFENAVNDPSYEFSERELQYLEDERVLNAFSELFAEDVKASEVLSEMNKARTQAYGRSLFDSVIRGERNTELGERGKETLDYAEKYGVDRGDALSEYYRGLNGEKSHVTTGMSEIEKTVLTVAYNNGKLDAITGKTSETVSAVKKPTEYAGTADTVEMGGKDKVRYASALHRKQFDIGTATVAESGEDVTIDKEAPIARISDGVVYMNTSEGEIPSTELAFAEDGTRAVINGVADLDVEIANAIIRNYAEGDPETYVAGMREGVVLGEFGTLSGDELAEYNTLSESDRAFARELGEALSETRQREAAESRASVEVFVPTTDMKSLFTAKRNGAFGTKGGVYALKGTRIDAPHYSDNLNFVRVVADVTGSPIVIYDGRTVNDEELKAANGKYVWRNGAIYVDMNAGTRNGRKGLVTFALAHELTHFAEQWASNEYRTYAEWLVKNYSESVNGEKLSIDALVRKRMSDESLSYDEAYREVVADFSERMLLDTDVLEKLEALRTQNESLFKRIVNKIKEFIGKIFSDYGRDNASYESNALRSLFDDKQMKEMHDRWTNMIVEGAKNRAAAVKGTKDTTSSTEKSSDSGKRSGAKSETKKTGKESYSRKGTAPDGTPIYESNFPKGTPKAAKAERILRYIQDVWSKKPITLVISNGETSRTIQAKFDPTYDPKQIIKTDASKLAGGNRHGNASEQRVALDLADDYYEIISDSKYNYSKEETGKTIETHNDVKMWHYFVNDIYFAEFGEDELTPYTVSIDVKEKENGDYVYNFSAEKKSPAPQILHSAVITRKGNNGELFIDSISQSEENDNTSGKKNTGKESYSRKTDEDYSTRAVIERALETAEEGSAERAALEAYKGMLDKLDEQTAAYNKAVRAKNSEAAARAKSLIETIGKRLKKYESAPALQRVAGVSDITALNDDVRNLSLLLKLQGRETKGQIALESSLDDVASKIMEDHGIESGKDEFVGLLKKFWQDMTREITAENLNREYMLSMAEPVADWIINHEPTGANTDAGYFTLGEVNSGPTLAWLRANAADEIAEAFWQIKPLVTVADKYAARIRELKETHEYKNVGEILRRERSKIWHRGYDVAVQRAQRAELRRRIRTLYENISTRLLKPKQNRYVPYDLRQTVAKVLTIINTDSGRSASLSARLELMKEQYKAILEMPKYQEHYDPELAEQISNLADIVKGEGDRNISISEMTYEQLDAVYRTMKWLDKSMREEVNMRDLTINGVKKDVPITEVRDKWTREIKSAKKKTSVPEMIEMWKWSPEAYFESIAGFKKDSYSTAIYNLLNEAQRDMYQMIMEGNFYLEDFLKDEKFLKRITDTKKGLIDTGLKDADGNPIRVTRDIAHALYLGLANANYRLHVMSSGGTFPDLQKYYAGKSNAYSGGNGTRYVGFAGKAMTELRAEIDENIEKIKELREDARIRQDFEAVEEYNKQIDAEWERWGKLVDRAHEVLLNIRDNIQNQFDAQELRYLDRVHDYYNVWTKARMNEASSRRYGFDIANEDDYIQIITDPNFRTESVANRAREMTNVANKGLAQRRIQAKNPLIFAGLTDMVKDHLKATAAYTAFLNPIYDMNRLIGPSEGGMEFTQSVRHALEENFGKTGKDYLDNLLINAQGGSFGKIRSDTIDRLFEWGRGRVAAAALTMNLNTAFVQTGSLLTAISELGWRPVMKAFPKMLFHQNNKANVMNANTPLFWMRSTDEMSALLENVRQIKKRRTPLKKWLFHPITSLIQKFDNRTVNALWYASEFYVNQHTDLKKENPEYINAVTDVFNRTVERTQPNYTAMQRPEILRNENALLRHVEMFKTQRYQNRNMLYMNTARALQISRDYKNHVEGVTKQDRHQARVKAVNTWVSQIVSSAYISLIKFVVPGLLLFRLNPWKDKKTGELTPQSVWTHIADDLLSSFFGNDTITAELYNIIGSAIFERNYFAGIGNGFMESVKSGLEKIADIAAKVKAGTLFKDNKGKLSSEKAMKELDEIAENFSGWLGIAYKNARNLVVGIYSHIQNVANGHAFDLDYDATEVQLGYRMLNALKKDDMDLYEETAGRFEASKTQPAKFVAQKKLLEVMSVELLCGNLSEDEAVDLLGKIGFDEDEANDQIIDWKTAPIKEALQNGDISEDEAEEALAEIGMTDEGVDTTTTKWRVGIIGEKLMKGDIDLEEAESELEELGLSPKKIHEQIGKWEQKIETGDSKGYTEYKEFDTALTDYVDGTGGDRAKTGKALEKMVAQYRDLGFSDQQIQTRITHDCKDKYLAASKSERDKMYGYIITAYTFAGLSRAEAAKRIKGWK